MYTIILTSDEYINWYGSPRDNEPLLEEDIKILENFIAQATNQFDSLISTRNNVGYLFKWYKNLTDNEQDLYKKEKIKRAIGSWVETMIISGKFWTDNVPTINSNISYNISSSAQDSRVEYKRQDIIQDLSLLGLLYTTNINNNQAPINENEIDDLIIVSKSYLENNYLKLDSFGQYLRSSVNFAAVSLINCGTINGSFNGGLNFQTLENFQMKNIGDIVATTIFQAKLKGFKLEDCIIEDIQHKLIAGENITLTENPDNTTTISATNGGDPNDSKFKSNFVNVMEEMMPRPKQELNFGDFLFANSTDVTRDIKGNYNNIGRVKLGWMSKTNNNLNHIPQYEDDENWLALNIPVRGGEGLILGAEIIGGALYQGWYTVPPLSICYDLAQFHGSSGSKKLEYWFTREGAPRGYGWTNTECVKEQVYPKTDPEVVEQVKLGVQAYNKIALIEQNISIIQDQLGIIDANINEIKTNLEEINKFYDYIISNDRFSIDANGILVIEQSEPYNLWDQKVCGIVWKNKSLATNYIDFPPLKSTSFDVVNYVGNLDGQETFRFEINFLNDGTTIRIRKFDLSGTLVPFTQQILDDLLEFTLIKRGY